MAQQFFVFFKEHWSDVLATLAFIISASDFLYLRADRSRSLGELTRNRMISWWTNLIDETDEQKEHPIEIHIHEEYGRIAGYLQTPHRIFDFRNVIAKNNKVRFTVYWTTNLGTEVAAQGELVLRKKEDIFDLTLTNINQTFSELLPDTAVLWKGQLT